LLLRQAVAPDEEDAKRRQEFSDRASVDDQPLSPTNSSTVASRLIDGKPEPRQKAKFHASR
jgi:hypothetical protein